MDIKTKIISFANMKGGVSKTTLTTIFANYVHNETDKSIIVIDCDNKQANLMSIREKDIRAGADPKYLYPLNTVPSTEFYEKIEMYIGEVDYILVDLPGTVMQEGVIEVYAMLDYLFVPTNITDNDLNSTVAFLSDFQQYINQRRVDNNMPETVVHGVLSKVNVSTKLFKEFYNETRKELPLRFLDSYIPYSEVSFGHNVSTAGTYNYFQGKGANEVNLTEAFCKEVFRIINEN